MLSLQAEKTLHKCMQKRLLLYFCDNTSYSGGLLERIKNYFDRIVFVSKDYENQIQSISYFELKEKWEDFSSDFQYIYFVNKYWFFTGDSFNFSEFLEQSTKQITELCDKEDVFGNSNKELSTLFYNTVAHPIFFCAPEKIFDIISASMKKTEDILGLYTELKVSYLNIWYETTYFQHLLNISGEFKEKNTVPLAYGLFEYVQKLCFPFVYMGVFMMYRSAFIKYGTDHQLKMLFELAVKKYRLNKYLIDFFKKECDAAFLKDLLQIIVIVDSTSSSKKRYNDTAVFAHLYYDELFEQSMTYLNRAAEHCDVYISICSQEKEEKIQKLVDTKWKSCIHILPVENRGRDMSSLLVGFKPYLNKYTYFCFLHDKRSHSEEPYTVGNAFSSCIWDNLIGNSKIIEFVRKYFIKNQSIGLLSPPPPYWGVYLGIKGNMWTICYEKTVDLAHSIGLGTSVSDKINPVALGSAFWCRTEAISSLLDKEWRYEDFDMEPLGIDGTLSHALERIFPYAALDKGYLSGWIMSDSYASGMLESHVYLLDRALSLNQNSHVDISEKSSEIEDENKIIHESKQIENNIGVKGALLNLFNAVNLLFKCFYKFIKKKIRKYGNK